MRYINHYCLCIVRIPGTNAEEALAGLVAVLPLPCLIRGGKHPLTPTGRDAGDRPRSGESAEDVAGVSLVARDNASSFGKCVGHSLLPMLFNLALLRKPSGREHKFWVRVYFGSSGVWASKPRNKSHWEITSLIALAMEEPSGASLGKSSGKS